MTAPPLDQPNFHLLWDVFVFEKDLNQRSFATAGRFFSLTVNDPWSGNRVIRGIRGPICPQAAAAAGDGSTDKGWRTSPVESGLPLQARTEETAKGLNDPNPSSFLSKGDRVTPIVSQRPHTWAPPFLS